ncbi:AAA family ATPase [Pseudomonas sp. CCI1.1]|uniref:AAA family ATPase n=1 Tax=unclassified Pseudomonas TaxID=196821 RepID=UPI001909C675|nr:AAA family ATPase [Pseudomonas fluorescens]MCF5518033.1 AAA family ATPase [Pseudomonas sp. PA-3-6E]MCF5565064.1 AAA family ATPase [Pseudomonas sp. PA-3-5D]MCF5570510.1 AAA family ATPase [Pseudomonas sp. PA-3-11C]MCF5596641.1 AAA family ATPase [Pseudomonas sp. PA-3-10C]
MLKSFSVENYRSFSRKQDIELRPLTLFFGWNSGGKSALLRFLPLVAESLRTGGSPIWLGGGGRTPSDMAIPSVQSNGARRSVFFA